MLDAEMCDAAIQQCKKAISIDSTCKTAYGVWGWALGLIEKAGNTVEPYHTEGIDSASAFSELYNSWGNISYRSGKYALALHKYEKAIYLDRHCKGAYAGWGAAWGKIEQDKQITDNTQFFQEITDSSVFLDEVYMGWGDSLYSVEDYATALEKYQQAIQENKNNALSYYKSALALHKLMRYEAAISNYQMAIENSAETDQFLYTYYILLGYSHGYLNQKSAELLKPIKKINTPAVSGYLNYGWGVAAHELKKYEIAQKKLKEAIKRKPSVSLLHDQLGDTLRKTGKYESATEAYKKAILREPSSAPSYRKLGEILGYNIWKQHDVKVDDTDISRLPMFADVYYGCGRFLYAKGEHRQSKKYYTKAIDFDSKNPLFYKQLGKALAELNRYDKAIEAYITVTELLLDNKKLDDDEERTQSTLIDKITATGLFSSSQQNHHVQAAHTDPSDDSSKPSQVASSIDKLSLAK
ncbi:MAG: tetratricopeptide repeat protein, partial [Cyanobacteria bacterium J06576_12]